MAMEKTGAAPPWKTLRVSHFPTATATAVYLPTRTVHAEPRRTNNRDFDVHSLTRPGTKSRSGQNLPRELIPSEAVSEHVAHDDLESVGIVHFFPIVVAE